MNGQTSKGDDLLIKTSEEFLQKANLNPKLYEEYIQWAKNDWEGFWDYFGKNEITWFEPFKKVFDDSNAPFYKFFVGGKLNISYNCIDRHLSTWKKNRAAIIWESEIGESKTITYRELYYQVNKFANVLKTLGVKKGDRVVLYMPMIVELPIAMLACARIGAIHSVVFGGFSPAALKERILDANANVIITADGGRRGGRAIPLKD
ncbi:MAG TPA: acetyl-coenzyme A synthetase, partial [Desulfurella acetivorans]|nr:acetyl-coenzyme A synthetase [Desulfurella acetivorans]